MHRIDVPSATAENKFTDGSPSGGVPATTVTADWLNDMQENLMAILDQEGVIPVKGRALDLFDAIVKICIGVVAGGVATNDYITFSGVDRATGIARDYLLQWGAVVTASNQQASVTFPVAYTGGHIVTVGTHYGSGGAMFVVSNPTNTGFTAIISTVTGGTGTGSFNGRWLSLGYNI